MSDIVQLRAKWGGVSGWRDMMARAEEISDELSPITMHELKSAYAEMVCLDSIIEATNDIDVMDISIRKFLILAENFYELLATGRKVVIN